MKEPKVKLPLVGRLGSEAFLSLVHRTSAGTMKDRRRQPRGLAKRRAIEEF
jgi:hypothetical protein